MAGSWREILESAGVDEADAEWRVGPGDAHRDEDSQGGEPPSSVEFDPPAEPRRWDEPELNAFLTRLASPPDAGPASLAEDGPASIRRRVARSQEEAPGNSLVLPVAAARAPAEAVAARKASAPVEAEKSAPPASAPPPVSREKRSWPGLLATSLLAAAVSLSAYAALSPSGKKPDISESPTIIEASRVRVETPSPSRRARVLRARHKRSAAGRAAAVDRCAYDPELPVCRWGRTLDR
jgi:hypothetical protein